MKKFDPKALPYLAATAQFVQFGHAGYILGGWVLAVIGGIIGVVVSFSVAYAGSQVASITGMKREKWVNVGTLAMLAISPLAIVAPVYHSFGVIADPVWRWITSAAWVLAPDAAILLDGLVTGKKLVAKEEKPAATETKPKETTSKKGAKVAKPLLNDATLQAWFMQHPDATQATAAKHFQVSHTAISKRLKRMYNVSKPIEAEKAASGRSN